ncbi:hypothetical protein FRB95_006769 [Tulasnella sp. JGI-2019a]|nr:hypothetical protein FRB95_006769 [Tulasnella sp. JGI-2019a]
MIFSLLLSVALTFDVCSAISTPETQLLRLGGQGINLWKLRQQHKNTVRLDMGAQTILNDLTQKTALKNKYPELYFQQPLDHFDQTAGFTFGQRYYVDDRFYKPGGPVIVLDGGETSAEDRLPFMDHGILAILSEATGGLSVILEHRYYGQSVPVANFSTDSLRWLTNEQALEDSARFMRNFKYDPIDEDLSAMFTPWIYYGGSYAGARAAHMRKWYPHLVFGGIASSAVTHAAIDYSDYYDVIRQTANQTCIGHIVSAIKSIDSILDIPLLSRPLKALFGLSGLEHDDDFVSLLAEVLGSVQATNWDQSVSSSSWDDFCEAINAGGAGMKLGFMRVPAEVMNYAAWVKKNIVSYCPEDSTAEECFGTYDDVKYQDESDIGAWRAWTFQVCTQWGYFMPAPADPEQPRIVSKRLTLEYTSKHCKQSFLPGKHFKIPPWPKVDEVNRLGDFGLTMNRLAFIDGSNDPWKAATPHSSLAPERIDTIDQPFKLIRGGVHHWDENGLEDPSKEPNYIRRIHAEEVQFVEEWLNYYYPTSS